MKIKAISALVVALLVALLGYWYYSPYLMVHNMKAAAQAQDAEAFNAYVDYPRVRQSIKAQFGSLVNDRIQASAQTDPTISTLGQAMGSMIASKMIDALVQPETVMKAMQEGRLGGKPAQPIAGKAPTRPQEGVGGGEHEAEEWTMERVGMSKAIAYPISSDDPRNETRQRVSVVIERRGFAAWQLTEVRLPEGMLK